MAFLCAAVWTAGPAVWTAGPARADSGSGTVLNADSFPGEWKTEGAAEVLATPLGTRFIRLSASPGEMVRLRSPSMALEEGSGFEVAFCYRTSVPNSRKDYGAWVWLDIQNAMGRSLKTTEVICPKSAAWREIRHPLTLPEGAARIVAQVRLQSAGGRFDLREFSMHAAKPAPSDNGMESAQGLEEVERFELVRSDGQVSLRSGSRSLAAKLTAGAPGGEPIQAFTLPADLCGPSDNIYEIETAFTVGAETTPARTGSLFTLGRNITGTRQPNSFSLSLFEGTLFIGRLTPENVEMATIVNRHWVKWHAGEKHTARVRFGTRSLEGWLDGSRLGDGKLLGDFSWPVGRPFYVGGESATESPWSGKIERFSLTVLRPWLHAKFDGGSDAGYFTGGDPHVWGLTFPKGQGKGVVARLRVRDSRGKPVGEEIAPKAPTPDKRKFSLPALPYGYYSIDASFAKEGKTAVLTHSFVIAPPLERVPAAESPFGIAIEGMSLEPHRFSKGFVREAFRHAAASGLRWVRFWVRWDAIEREPGVWHWEEFDLVVKQAKENGIELYPCLVGGALPFQTTQPRKKESWSMMTPACYMPANLELWKNYLRAMAERYKGTINIYQIWNEPDARNGFYPFDPKSYVEVLKTSAETLRAVDPRIRIGLGGFAAALMEQGLSKPSYTQADTFWPAGAFYAENPGPYFDVVDAHFYSVHEPGQSWDRVAGVARETHEFMERIGEGNKPLWNSETSMYSGKEGERGGWANVPFISETAQAMEIIRFHVQSLAVGIERTFWYGLRDNFGILQDDFSPKPAFAAQVNLVRMMQGARFVDELPLGPNLRAYRFNVSGQERIALWTIGDAVPLGIVNTGAKNFTETDAFGNERAHAQAVNLLTLTSDPIFLTSRGHLKVSPLAHLSLAASDESLPINASRLSLFNPSDATVKVEYAFSAGGKEGALQTVDLAPGEEKNIDVTLPAESNPVCSEVRFSGGLAKTFETEQTLPFRKVVSLAVGTASLSLDSADQLAVGNEVRDLQARIVTEAAWKEPKDLSAKIDLRRAGGKVIFHAVVTDNVVVAAAKANSPWLGDCVEVFLKKPSQPGVPFHGMISADGCTIWAGDRVWEGFEANVTKTPEGYTVDGSFPADGKRLDFNLAVDDADAPGGRKSQIFWALGQSGVILLEP
ncbi:MAG: hypothetical protein ACFUZC_11505 [Chthoniobacteraceae bacterium]